MKSRIFDLDWDQFDYRDREQRRFLAGALQYFLSLPNRFVPPAFEKIQAFADKKREISEAVAKLQEFTTTADFPPSMLPIIEKLHILPSYDTGYEQIFDVRDFSGSKRNGFTVYSVQSGLTFNKVMVGEKLKVYQMSGGKSECYFDFYGGALGWSRMLFDDGDWWAIEDNAIQFRNKAYGARASVFYQLIEAVKDAKSSCISLGDAPCSGCDSLVRADATALNHAAETIALANLNKGYGDVANATYIILAPIQLRARIRQALAVVMQPFAGSERIADFKFQLITSTMLTDPTIAFVILPKLSLKAGYRMDLTLFEDFDILSYSDTQAGWMRFGGCVGDIDQIECVDLTVPSGFSA